MTDEYFVRYIPFPNTSVQAATFPNDDGTFDIYVNTLLSGEAQRRALNHELEHIRLGHFYSEDDIRVKEAQADGISEPVRGRRIPLFDSPEELARWILKK
jgi:hypothetical protein